MGIQLQVTTRGIPAAIARSKRQERGLIDAMRDAAEEGLDLTAALVRANTPVMAVNRGGSKRFPGELMGSIQSRMVVTDSGRVMGRIWTDLEWAPFVEWGTREHGRARHMFGLGQREARPMVKAIFERRVAQALRGF